MPPEKKIKKLSLKEKVEIINFNDKEKKSVRDLSKIFGVGKTCVAEVLKKKKDILKKYAEHGNDDSKKIFKAPKGAAIDKMVFEWLCRAREKNSIPISGTLIREKALEVAQILNIDNFKASGGWLDKFKLRHKISYRAISGESAGIQQSIVTDWFQKLKELCEGYSPNCIYNCDETALFFKALPDQTMSLKGETCKGGKVSKERVTVLLCTNMDGEFEQPLIIGKALKPQCFKNVDLNLFNIKWHANKKAWMTRSIMTDWLISFNCKMQIKKKNVLLFMDNATSHPQNLDDLSNVKIIFLPANTTASCQPLDQGIIKNFKTHYRKLILRHILAKMDDSDNAQELGKKINVLNAIQWVNSSIKEIKKQTVVNCFLKSGFPRGDSDYSENAEDSEIDPLISRLPFHLANSESYINIDSAAFTEEESLDLEEIVRDAKEEDPERFEDEEEEEADAETDADFPVSKREALESLEKAKKFFMKNDTSTADSISALNVLIFNLEKEIALQKKNSDKNN